MRGSDEARAHSGRVVGGYRLERPLGQGGMADVWLGRGVENGGLAALKLLRPTTDPSAKQLFDRERRAVLRLRHPNVVPVFDVGEDYIACAYIEGVDLRHRMRAPISVHEAVDITCAIGSALSSAHSEGIVHCDVKPGNILLDHKGTPFLADFGIARFVDDPDGDDEAVVGTPAFMAPEQLAGDPTPKADQYALAKTLLAMLGGSPTDHPARAILTLEPGLADVLAPVLARALDADPDVRFADVDAFVAALRALDLPDLDAGSRLAPVVNDASRFRWASLHCGMRRFGEHIVRADYRLGDLAERGALAVEDLAAFRAATGYADFGWSMYARAERLGPIDDPLAMARARQSIVLLHGLFTSRELWHDIAVGIARDNGLAVVLVPDVMGFGESKLGEELPNGALRPSGVVRAMNAWLSLIGVGATPTAVVGHSYSAAALICARREDLGEDVHRICLTPALFRERVGLRILGHFWAILALVMSVLPMRLTRWLARRIFRRDPSLERVRISVRDALADSAIDLGPMRLAGLFWHFANARPAPSSELASCTIVTAPDDPLVPPDLARDTIAAAGLPESQWYRLVHGGHFPQLTDDDNPGWAARNIHELVSLVDQVIEMAHTTARERRGPASSSDESATVTARSPS